MSLAERQARAAELTTLQTDHTFRTTTFGRNLVQAREFLGALDIEAMLEDIVLDDWHEGKVEGYPLPATADTQVGFALRSKKFTRLRMLQPVNNEFSLIKDTAQTGIFVTIPLPHDRDISVIEVTTTNVYRTHDHWNKPLSVADSVKERGLKDGLEVTATLKGHQARIVTKTGQDNLLQVSLHDSNVEGLVEQALMSVVGQIDYHHARPSQVRDLVEKKFLKELPPELDRRGQVDFKALREWGYKVRGWDKGWGQLDQLADRVAHDWFGRPPR